MELSQFYNGIAMHNDVIRQVINNDSLYVKHEDGYSYTVGMRNIGAPELVIYGQRKIVADEMFKIIYIAAAQAYGEQDLNTVVKNVFDPAPSLTALPEREKKALFYAARTYYDDWTFSVFKITLKTNMSDS
ncbi:MAG: hypothetical protein COA54_02900 [Thiotrichaceae bacterium]|nr:MAG: hypothetical protein COA54_02900 [Thiotrichaceae bacterium]